MDVSWIRIVARLLEHITTIYQNIEAKF